MGNVTGLMIRCTPRAKCNYMLSRATIKKEAAVNYYSSQTISSTVAAGRGLREKCGNTGTGWGLNLL